MERSHRKRKGLLQQRTERTAGQGAQIRLCGFKINGGKKAFGTPINFETPIQGNFLSKLISKILSHICKLELLRGQCSPDWGKFLFSIHEGVSWFIS